MLRTFISNKDKASNDAFASRRHYIRRNCDKVISVINGDMCPVQNWSNGGALIESDDRIYSDGQEIDITLKFRLDHSFLDLDHKGKIVRKGKGRIALKFAPLTEQIKSGFRKVIDDQIANEFVNSQI